MEDKQKILLTEITKEGILRIVMNDPNSKNALSEIMINSLIAVSYTHLRAHET